MTLREIPDVSWQPSNSWHVQVIKTK